MQASRAGTGPPLGRVTVCLATSLTLLLGAPGCSIKRMAINKVGNTLASAGSVYASDDDPELVREALPFGLKTIEGLLAEVPQNRNLLLAACSGFTQYAFAFVETDALLLEPDDYLAAEALRHRALRLTPEVTGAVSRSNEFV